MPYWKVKCRPVSCHSQWMPNWFISKQIKKRFTNVIQSVKCHLDSSPHYLRIFCVCLSTPLRVVRCKQFTTNEGMRARRWGGKTKKNHWYPTMSGYSSKGDLLQPIYRWFDDWKSPSEQLNSTHTHTVDKFLGACSFLPSMATIQAAGARRSSTIIHLIISIYYDTEHEFINAHRAQVMFRSDSEIMKRRTTTTYPEHVKLVLQVHISSHPSSLFSSVPPPAISIGCYHWWSLVAVVPPLPLLQTENERWVVEAYRGTRRWIHSCDNDIVSIYTGL